MLYIGCALLMSACGYSTTDVHIDAQVDENNLKIQNKDTFDLHDVTITINGQYTYLLKDFKSQQDTSLPLTIFKNESDSIFDTNTLKVQMASFFGETADKKSANAYVPLK